MLCTWNWNIPTSRVGGGLVELESVNDALSCSLLMRDELLETLLICPLALLLLVAAPFALLPTCAFRPG